MVAIRAGQVSRRGAVTQGLNRVAAPASPRLIPALGVLKRVAPELANFGIDRAGVFGSTARGKDTTESDVDVVVTLADGAAPDPIDLIKVEERLRAGFADAMPGVMIDVSLREDMRAHVQERCDTEAIYAV